MEGEEGAKEYGKETEGEAKETKEGSFRVSGASGGGRGLTDTIVVVVSGRRPAQRQGGGVLQVGSEVQHARRWERVSSHGHLNDLCVMEHVCVRHVYVGGGGGGEGVFITIGVFTGFSTRDFPYSVTLGQDILRIL